MKTKVFKHSNLKGYNKIRITSQNNTIDFAKESTGLTVYFDDFVNPKFYLFAELYTFKNNQTLSTAFDLPVLGTEAAIVIEAFTDYDLDKIKVLSLQ